MFMVNVLVQISLWKGVWGDCDVDFVFFDFNGLNLMFDNFNGIGCIFQGGVVDWKFIIENIGNVEVKDIMVIDIMLFIGDEVIFFFVDWESEWWINFVEVIFMLANVIVEYFIEFNFCCVDFSLAYEFVGCIGLFWSMVFLVDVIEI